MTLRLVLMLVILAALSLLLGIGGMVGPQSLAGLWQTNNALAHTILVNVRLPRMVLGLAVGGTLGLSGAALQGLLRNPLVSPDVIGTTSAASVGAIVMYYFSPSTAGPLGVGVGAMAGACIGLLLVLGFAGRYVSTVRIVLAGVAVSALAGALSALALSLAPSPFALYDILFWIMGSLTDRSLEQVLYSLPIMIVGAGLILYGGKGLDALALGEEAAQSLGVDIKRSRYFIVAGTALAVGASVAVCGSIGFIGLIVPHLVRRFVGYSPRATLIPSALAGACLLTAADIAVRLVPSANELRLGVLTALIGAPFFIALILKVRHT